jgi:hypothetical protein
MISCLDSPIRRRLFLFLGRTLVSAAVGVGGCAPSAAPKTAEITGSAASSAKDFGAKPSDAEAKEFAKELIAAIESNDVNKFNGLVDWTAMFEQVTGGIEVPADWKQGFQTGFLSSLAKPGGMFATLAGLEKSGGTLTLLHVHQVEGRPHALIRVMVGETGVNYLDFELARRADGKIRATDFYVFLSGEKFTKTIRALYLPLAANQSRNVVEKLLTSESDMVKAFPKISELSGVIRNGQHKEALAIYDSLPAGARKEKSIMLLRLQAAQATNDDSLYLAAMEDLAKTFPNDPCVDLTAIDAFVIHKEYDKALSAIARLEQTVGGDPYLTVLRSTLLVEQGKYDEAAKFAQDALAAEPTLRQAHYGRLQIANAQRKYGDMTKFLTEYEAAFHESLEGIATDPEFAGFVASAEYKQYKKDNNSAK